MVRPTLWEAVALSTLGVLATAVTLAALLHVLLQYSFLQALLLGAIVSSTDAAAAASPCSDQEKLASGDG